MSKLSNLGERPQDFYGFEDWDGTEPWEETEERIKEKQIIWDQEYSQLSNWEKFRYNWVFHYNGGFY